jgi:hypothetical protein
VAGLGAADQPRRHQRRPDRRRHPRHRAGPLFTFAPFRIRYVDDRARTWSWWVGFGPAGVGMDHGVDDTGTGSRAWVRIHAHRWLAAPYAPIARLALRRLVKE